MIFVNRRRIKQNSGIVKDPTQYWYVEKYVYGVLKETVEIALGSGTTFGSIDSGYSDDTFYGWSVSSTSTTRTFTSTSSYKNTTTAVKNNLDSENTLKIYAIYKYTETTWSVSNTEVFSCDPSSSSGSNGTTKYYTTSIEVAEDSTAKFGGYTYSIYGVGSATSTPSVTYSDLTYNNNTIYAKIDDDIYITGTVNTYNVNTKYVGRDVTAGQIITLGGYVTGTQTISSSKTAYCVSCTVPHWVESKSTKYRVSSH